MSYIVQVVGLHNKSYKPITNTVWVRARLCKLQKGCTRLTAASDTVYQLLAYGRWFSPGTPASSTTKTGCHDIAEILLKVALKHQKINQSMRFWKCADDVVFQFVCFLFFCLFHHLLIYNQPQKMIGFVAQKQFQQYFSYIVWWGQSWW